MPTFTHKLNREQREHLERLKSEFSKRVTEKYAKGAEEHGGNLWDVDTEQILEYALEEVEDLWVYLFTIKEKLSANKD